jgi:hypothetical protein
MRFLSALADLPPVKPPSSWELRSRMGRRPSSSARKFEQGSGSSAEFLRLAQVVYTLTQFETIDRVSCQLEGEPVELFGGHGSRWTGRKPVRTSNFCGNDGCRSRGLAGELFG